VGGGGDTGPCPGPLLPPSFPPSQRSTGEEMAMGCDIPPLPSLTFPPSLTSHVTLFDLCVQLPRFTLIRSHYRYVNRDFLRGHVCTKMACDLPDLHGCGSIKGSGPHELSIFLLQGLVLGPYQKFPAGLVLVNSPPPASPQSFSPAPSDYCHHASLHSPLQPACNARENFP
jgi:hypothetical protein